MLSSRGLPASVTALSWARRSLTWLMYQRWMVVRMGFIPVLCDSVWCASFAPTQVCLCRLNEREYCIEAMRVRSQARAATRSLFITVMMAGKLSFLPRSMPPAGFSTAPQVLAGGLQPALEVAGEGQVGVDLGPILPGQ